MKEPINLKSSLKVNDILVDDMGLVYRVLEVFKLCVVAEPFPNKDQLGGDVMSYKAMEEEGWAKMDLSLLPTEE